VKKFYISDGNGVFFKDSAPPKPLFFYDSDAQPNQNKNHHHRRPFRKLKKVNESVHALKETVPICLARLFPGGKILPYHLPDWLSTAVRVKIAHDPNEVDLDVDITRLQRVLLTHAIFLLDQKNYSEGLKVLESLLLLDPNNFLTLYNLACAEALLGNSEKAINYLSSSVSHGYTNLDHLLKDSDLDSLRQLPGYLKIVEYLRSNEKKS